MLSVENIATPATAVTVTVPDSVPFPGFVTRAIVKSDVKFVTMLPPASSAVTVTAGASVAPAVVVPGGTAKTNRLAAPTATSNDVVVTSGKPLAVKTSV